MEIESNQTNFSDERSFEAAFKQYYSQLSNFAYQYVNDDVLAEEIVQETFSNVWLKSSQIEIRTNARSYLYGAVRNACLNYIKHQKVKMKYVERELYRSNSDNVDFLELSELQEEISKAIDRLPEKCRLIFEMSRYEEMKNKEIAQELGLSLKTIENQMNRALKEMRRSLSRYLPVIILMTIYWMVKNMWG